MIIGEYVFVPNKMLLKLLLDTLDVSVLSPRQAIERKLQKEIVSVLASSSVRIFAAEDVKASVEKELNSALNAKGVQLHADFMDFKFSLAIQKIIGEAQKSFAKVRKIRADLEKAQAQTDSLLNIPKPQPAKISTYDGEASLADYTTDTLSTN